MHCSICQIDFNTLSAYVKHHRDLHSHSKKIRLICYCGGSFSTLRSLQTHWYRFHNEKTEQRHEDIAQDEDEGDQEEFLNADNQEEVPDSEFRLDTSDGQDQDLENESINTSNGTESLSEEEQLKAFEKRVLYLLLTLQTVFYTSEAAIDFVTTNLTELFLAMAAKNLNLNALAVCIDQLKSSHIRKKKATEYFQYIEPVSRSYKPNYLKIELNSDDLTITNPISHRAHSIFFFYWSLLNVSREKRSRQATKRLIAACPKWARKYNSLSHTVDDFLMGMHVLSTSGRVSPSI
ncbi:unnamed protein product [Rotaria sordida]|uniref:C2H2-type domain-containing protein n=2 Tax=Rotaria sordida TaxID=392033 RepID=A0A819GV40_9BILA|nr:unnamed protein product [Rotaria sordida]